MRTERKTPEEMDIEERKLLLQDEKFGKDHPTITTLKQSVGPWLFNTVYSLQDTISVAFLAIAYPNTNYSSAISSILSIKTLFFNICTFFSNGVTIQLANLHSQRKDENAKQLLVDCLRVGFCVALLLFIIFAAAGKAILRGISIPESILDLDYKYMLTCGSEMIFYSLFDNMCSALQGEGRATLASMMQIFALLISNFISDPIFMFACHAPPWACGFSVCLGATILGVVLFILFARGVFNTKIEFHRFLKKFTPETYTALKVGILPFCQYLFGLVPALIMQSVIVRSSKESGLDEATSGIFGIGLKVYLIVIQSATGALSGLYGPASWAHAKRLFKRIRYILYSSWIIALIPIIIFCPLMIAKPSVLLKIWIKSEVALSIGDHIVPKMFYTTVCYPFMQSMTFTIVATIKSAFSITPLVCKAIILIFGTIILGKVLTHSEDVVYIFIPGDVVGLIAGIITFRILGKEIWFGEDHHEGDDEQELETTEEL